MKNKTIQQLKDKRRSLADFLNLDIDLQRRAEILIEIDELTKEIKRRERSENKKSVATSK